MSRFLRCDGCGGEVDRPGVWARRSETMTGDEVPPADFDWCMLCSRAAFRGVAEEAKRRRRSVPTEMRPGSAPVPALGSAEATRVMQGPAANVQSWLPRRSRQLEETRVVGELPR